ncbi:MAG: hypothetical protein LBL82_02630 [Oscillospiraceae bacterium]|nr:hypothetical protein [Oscillospiraceae bacterium]
MNIVLGLALIIGAIVINFKFSTKTLEGLRNFTIVAGMGIIVLFSMHTFDTLLLTVLTVAEIALAGVLLIVYYKTAKSEREKEARARERSKMKAAEALRQKEMAKKEEQARIDRENRSRLFESFAMSA